ncbi:MAG: prepilin-type N-terminal cleavage/methylation domain-containing protein, partial [Gammaproteobacteria bacterium]|nr:prepilin-type N-terminal cleavage/methylation domain-containing protein [Gammaproteobacteria bacterium]
MHGCGFSLIELMISVTIGLLGVLVIFKSCLSGTNVNALRHQAVMHKWRAVIGMFSFDVSNWFLHLLQICMNAPIDSKLKHSRVIFWIYWVGVIPSFVLTRFV